MELDTPISTISATLRHLREVDLVRYLTSDKYKVYWVKEPKMLALMVTLEGLIDTMRNKRE